jgi:hypothetical protein
MQKHTETRHNRSITENIMSHPKDYAKRKNCGWNWIVNGGSSLAAATCDRQPNWAIGTDPVSECIRCINTHSIDPPNVLILLTLFPVPPPFHPFFTHLLHQPVLCRPATGRCRKKQEEAWHKQEGECCVFFKRTGSCARIYRIHSWCKLCVWCTIWC